MTSPQLQPGEQIDLVIEFLTNVDGPGKHSEVITLVTNDPKQPESVIQFTVTVR